MKPHLHDLQHNHVLYQVILVSHVQGDYKFRLVTEYSKIDSRHLTWKWLFTSRNM